MNEKPDEPNSEADAILENFEMIRDELREARASNLAVLRILKEIAPISSPEIGEIIGKYSTYYRENMEKLLSILESRNPARAAWLDKHRPLISPDEDMP